MIFGDKEDFAIEAMIEPDLRIPSSPWGRMCVWVQGVSIGDFEEPHCGLGSACDGFVTMSSQLDDLWIQKFSEFSDLEIWNYLDGLLYGYHGNKELNDDRSLEQTLNDSAEYSKFDFLTNWGEMFDRGGKSFLMRQPSGLLKILNYDYENSKVNSFQCSEFNFRKAAKELNSWYEQQAEILEGKNA